MTHSSLWCPPLGTERPQACAIECPTRRAAGGTINIRFVLTAFDRTHCLTGQPNSRFELETFCLQNRRTANCANLAILLYLIGFLGKLISWNTLYSGRGHSPQLGDEVTWSDITDIQLECYAFRSAPNWVPKEPGRMMKSSNCKSEALEPKFLAAKRN